MILNFENPALLWALFLLPLLYWLLRLLPPAPRRIIFPPLALLQGYLPRTTISLRSPWWLLLLRLAICALLIAGFAGPRLLPPQTHAARDNEPAQPPMLVLIDNSWSSGGNWESRQQLIGQFCDSAAAQGKSLSWLATAEAQPHIEGPLPAAAACGPISRAVPRPWPNDIEKLSAVLKNSLASYRGIMWAAAPEITAAEKDLILQISKRHDVALIIPGKKTEIAFFSGNPDNGKDLTVAIRRSDWDLHSLLLDGYNAQGKVISTQAADFPIEQKAALIPLKLDAVRRNSLSRITIDGQAQAGATLLLDNGARRPGAGIIAESSGNSSSAQPLLDEKFYLDTALSAQADVRKEPLAALLRMPPDLIIWPGSALLTQEERRDLAQWVNNGGVLLRFAGASVDSSSNAPDTPELLPEHVIDPERLLGETNPVSLETLPPGSPLNGTPAADMTIRRYLLTAAASRQTAVWASLSDHTPFITATPEGRGFVILCHVPATPLWSSLPLSRLFLALLHASLDLGLSSGEGFRPLGERNANMAEAQAPLQLISMLDGFGVLRPASSADRPAAMTPAQLAQAAAGPDAPPGLYSDGHRLVARNLGPLLDAQSLMASAAMALPHFQPAEEKTGTIDLTGALLLFAFVLLAWDAILSARLRGYGPALRKAATMLLMLLLFYPHFAAAADSAAIWIGAIVPEGQPADPVAAEGLTALAHVAMERTNLDDVRVENVAPGSAQLPLYAMLYWRVTSAGVTHPIDAAAAARLRDYMAAGGLLVIDFTTAASDTIGLRQLIAQQLAIPRLVRADGTSTVARSYYLLSDFPGVNGSRPLWIEAEPSAQHDGASSVVVGDADWAAAWSGAHNAGSDLPMRVGINLLMYALTGAYKSDQLHVRALLERLGPQSSAPQDKFAPAPVPGGVRP